MANVRGRGTGANPPNRFEKRSVVPDPDASDPDAPLPRTQFLKDASRTIIARNESPDIGFERSINPYRGCEHGCVYCLSGNTPILLADGSLRALADIRPGDEIYGTRRFGGCRRYVKTKVTAHWSSRKPAFRVILEDGTELVASADHRFLTEGGWKSVAGSDGGQVRRPRLYRGSRLMGVGRFGPELPRTRAYERGYLAGLFQGHDSPDAWAERRGERGNGIPFRFRLFLTAPEPLERAMRYLEPLGVKTRPFAFSQGTDSGRRFLELQADSEASISSMKEIVSRRSEPSADWSRGFLAGIFDAGGRFSEGSLRIAGREPESALQIEQALRRVGIPFRTDAGDGARRVRLRGDLSNALRFFRLAQPSIARAQEFVNCEVRSSARLGVASIEPLGRREDLFDLTTGTGDFIADGVVSHNCYARPTHEFLGYSSGLDFESRILVKEDATELLRAELSSPKWSPQTIAISGVTDAYQPAERIYGLTRGCLGVLAEFRNPALIITKNHLVTRDIDLLKELARHGAAAVVLSITTLDAELARRLEPRTSTPSRRLAAIEALAQAGIPAGVNVAPIIPGLTDSEIPAILKAAAKAGASFAGHTLVRLPFAVKDLFEEWLKDHYPGRKEKILHRIRGVRSGALNDPRFGSRMNGEGAYAEQIGALFELARKKAGISADRAELSAASFRVPPGPQLTLF